MSAERIAVIGLGYVGLPLAVAFARKGFATVGFDIDASRVAELRQGKDRTGTFASGELSGSGLVLSHSEADIASATFFVVAVPTPVTASKQPDLGPVTSATRTVGRALRPGVVVVYESTVYPGVTEDICGPLLERESGLTRGKDFKLGYSPERVNPGDREHTMERIVKIVSGEDADALERVAAAYARVAEAGVYRAGSIRVAEAAKVIENTQRDVNIALINELAIIFERLGIRTREVLEAAGTKWNFLRFRPGLVGGHCIGVDPYYLTTKAEEAGYHPQLILAGRRVNDSMGFYVAQKAVKLLTRAGRSLRGCRVAILGVTFKENVNDIRNSRVPDIRAELISFGIEPLVHDPLADAEEVRREYGIELVDDAELRDLDCLILAVAHSEYRRWGSKRLLGMLTQGSVLVDVQNALEECAAVPGLLYWSL
jgi:UDP-N-acetyl-D-glucosamine/UDP-N-acetyl-D-galactosamine dehydrogenase